MSTPEVQKKKVSGSGRRAIALALALAAAVVVAVVKREHKQAQQYFVTSGLSMLVHFELQPTLNLSVLKSTHCLKPLQALTKKVVSQPMEQRCCYQS